MKSEDICRQVNPRAIKDALEVLNGSWKLPTIVALYEGKKRFKEIARQVEGISDKMLSKVLKEMDMDQLVTRTVLDNFQNV